ncbi:Histone H4 [Gossypium australe]|uniref:Histone H4 n=1 Tax=Gossypium australe TaxID=47621 RepID=A0A5B6VRN6_9ROSI|nr:Histone H4 [Gossypium australe]
MQHQQGEASPRRRSSAYLNALSLEIEKRLQRKRNILQELFADLALEIDDRAKDIILSREDLISSAEYSVNDRLCFYDVLANYYVRVPLRGKPILDLIVQVWSQSFASHTFALLFHKWLFEVELDHADVLLRYSSALVQGATNVLWIDIQSNARCFQSLFKYLLDEVALEPTRLNKIPVQVSYFYFYVKFCMLTYNYHVLPSRPLMFCYYLPSIICTFQAQRDLYLLLSRFIFFYNAVEKLESFLKLCPTFPNAILVGGPADIFVTEVADQLQKLKVEPVLLHYLVQIKVLGGMQLRIATSTRLKTCLYNFTSPGGPMYPTRAVRHAAWDALDLLFPVGRYPRHLISMFFRLLYPWYWPSSCWNFILCYIKAMFYCLLRLIFSSWGKLREPKRA